MDIFRDTQVPAWLEALPKTNKALASMMGETLGLNLSAAIKHFTEPEAEQLKGSILDRLAATGSQWAQAVSKNKETSAWMSAIPEVAAWMSLSPDEQLTSTPDTKGSQTAIGIVQKQKQAVEANKIKEQQVQNQVKAAKMIVQSHAHILKRIDALSKDDPISAARIGKLTDTEQQLRQLAYAEASQKAAKAAAADQAKDTSDAAPVLKSQVVDGKRIFYASNRETGHLRILNSKETAQARSIQFKLAAIDARRNSLSAKGMNEDNPAFDKLDTERVALQAQLQALADGPGGG